MSNPSDPTPTTQPKDQDYWPQDALHDAARQVVGRVSLTPAQVSMLLEGIDWRMPRRVRRPELAG